MDVILSLVEWQLALVLLGEIVVLPRSLRHQINRVKQLLSLLGDAGATLKLNKCDFVIETFDHLDHNNRPRRLETATLTTDAIKGLKNPTNINEL